MFKSFLLKIAMSVLLAVFLMGTVAGCGDSGQPTQEPNASSQVE